MSNQFKPPPEFIETKNPAEAWADWRQRFTIYAAATNLTSKAQATQVAILLHTLGPVGIKIYNNFALDPTSTLDAVLVAFDEYFKPYKNLTTLSFNFLSTKQNDLTVDQYVNSLKTQARDCEFGSMTDRLVRDVLICGIRDLSLREKLLTLTDPSLAEVVGACRAAEVSKQQTQQMSQTDAITVNAINSQRTHIRSKRSQPSATYTKRQPTVRAPKDNSDTRSTKPCYCCGARHPPRKCPASGLKCHKCGKLNHFAAVCRQKNIQAILQPDMPDCESTSEGLDFLVASLTTHPTTLWQQKVRVNNNLLDFRLDTGSDINVIPLSSINSWAVKPTLEKAAARAMAYSGHPVPIVGKFTGQCELNLLKLDLLFHVTNVEALPVLNGPACISLGLINRLSSLDYNPASHDTSSTQIIQKFSDVFADGLGRIQKSYHISLRDDAIPVVTPPRRIPQSLLQPVKTELERMVTLGVIEKVNHPTDWVNALLPLQKGDKVRIALDPRPLNKAIRRQHYPIPMMEAIHGKLLGCRVFTVLDGRDAFWQMELDRESSMLCTFATPFGRFRFLRVPYGISPAPEFQQQLMDELCESLTATVPFFDDVIIGGKDLADHNQRLEQFLIRAREMGLRLKPSKTQLAQRKVTFVGHQISEHGVQPSQHTTQAIDALAVPTSPRELQRFLGLITYIGKFIPNLSERATYLRSLLRTSGAWNWSDRATRDFNDLKNSVVTAPVLALFDPEKPLILSVDASQYGLGATILQEGKPIAYASATLTQAQQRYAQIEKELLAIVFGCIRFHYYTYGRRITVETDHKPLLAIVSKPMDAISPRLQRLLLKLQRYSLELIHVPGRYLYVADSLSRSPSTDQAREDIDDDALQVHTLLYPRETDARLENLRKATSEDPELKQLIQIINKGWPSTKQQLTIDLQPYWRFKNDLHHHNGLIYRGTQILIPTTLRRCILSRVHESHQGIVASKARAREHLFWPGLNSQIEDLVGSCPVCQQTAPPNRKEPMLPYAQPTGPWERISIDFLKLQGTTYLLLVDSYSKFVELLRMTGTSTAQDVIKALKAIFSRHGIPLNLVSDNGPPFDSAEFKRFTESWSFQHTTSSPTYPQSNGLVERNIRTIKTLLKKSLSSGGDPSLIVLNHNTTPHDGLPAPSSLLMSRRLRTTIPGPAANYHPTLPDPSLPQVQAKRTQKQSNYYNKGAKPLTPIPIGAPALMETRTGSWTPTQIIKPADEPRSYWVQSETGRLYRRNRRHLRPWRTPIPDNSIDIAPSKPHQTLQTNTTLAPADAPPEPILLSAPLSQPTTPPQLAVPKDPPNGTLTTRSGRVIVKPARYRD